MGRQLRSPAAALIVVLMVAATSILGIHVASAQLAAVSPTLNQYGYPTYYQDSNGLMLQQCLEPQNPLCGFAAGDVPNPAAPLAIPDNFPMESFYNLAASTMPTNGGGQALLVLGLEATFANGLTVQAGDQVVFARLRLRVDNLTAGQTYTVTHPFGTRTFTNVAAGTRGINFTDDVGVLTPGNFNTGLGGAIGPFLQWDAGAPAGYLGDATTPHRVTGGTNGNLFRIDGPDVGGLGVNSIQTDLFVVQGQIYVPPVVPPTPTATATATVPAVPPTATATLVPGAPTPTSTPLPTATPTLEPTAPEVPTATPWSTIEVPEPEGNRQENHGWFVSWVARFNELADEVRHGLMVSVFARSEAGDKERKDQGGGNDEATPLPTATAAATVAPTSTPSPTATAVPPANTQVPTATAVATATLGAQMSRGEGSAPAAGGSDRKPDPTSARTVDRPTTRLPDREQAEPRTDRGRSTPPGRNR